MKAKIVCFKFSKTRVVFLLIIVIEIAFILYEMKQWRESRNLLQIQESASFMQIQHNIEDPNQMVQHESRTIKNEVSMQKQEQEIHKNVKKPYESMPREKKGFKVIGKITIPKIKLDTYILEETTTKSLKISVTKLYGPGIHEVGNFCIAGHNYRNNKMFGGIKKLEKGDLIIVTDPYEEQITYEVYDKYQTSPKDVSCLEQETGGDRELTLITCTAGAVKRVIVKAVEVYD